MEDVTVSEVTEAPEIVETPIVEQAVTTENAEPNVEVVEPEPEKTFTQAELNEIIKSRVERERDSATKKASQAARDAYVAEQGYVHPISGEPIKTESEYNQALKDQELANKYREQELPDEVIAELVESKKFREQYENDQRTTAEKSKQESDFKSFIEAFPDAKPDEIPPTVWADVNKGSSLVDAYTRHENAILKQKLAEVEKTKQIEQQNQENAASSTGSVTGNGVNAPSFFTLEQVKAMSQSEVNKNYDAIIASQKKWYK